MDTTTLSIEIAKLAVGGVLAVGVAWFWNRQRYLLEQYQYLDESYRDLLKSYFDHPKFGDKQKTAAYETEFKGDDAPQYHYFAMRVHTLLETMFDVYRGRIPPEWAPVFNHHARLHKAWLERNAAVHEPSYTELVTGGLPVSDSTRPHAPTRRTG